MDVNSNTATNSKIYGKNNSYDCWEFRYSKLRILTGRNLICIASYRTLPIQDHFIYARFCKTIEEFKADLENINHIIYSLFFIPSSEEEAQSVIEDIMSCN